MAAGITERDGMVYAGEVPWHGLGTRFDAPLSFEQALDGAKLRWNVSTRDLAARGEYLPDPDGNPYGVELPEHRAIVRDDTREVFGVVSKKWQPLQNEAAAKFLDQVLDTSESVIETAGSLFGGRRIWFLAKLPNDIEVNGSDTVKPYLLLANGHDGTLALHVKPVLVRVVCNNTLGMALMGGGREFKLIHSLNIAGRVEEARAAIGLVFNRVDQTGRAFQRLAETAFDQNAFQQLVTTLLPSPIGKTLKDEQERERVAKARLSMLGTYLQSPTVDRVTAWGAYNAVTQWFDHVKPSRDGKYAADRKTESVWFGRGDAFKQLALGELVAAGRG